MHGKRFCSSALGVIIAVILPLSCKKVNKKDTTFANPTLLFPANSSYLENKIDAFNFIENNIPYHHSQKIYVQSEDKVTPLPDLCLTSKKTDFKNAKFDIKTISDSLIIKDSLLSKIIIKAVYDWKELPWNKGVDKFTFNNYLLPYKINNEYPEDWRTYFNENKYISRIRDSLIKNYSKIESIDPNNEVFYKVIINNQHKWFEYAPEFEISSCPSLSELLCIGKGGCQYESYLSVYISRAIGLPATIDLVPFWGSRNSGHASPVFWSVKENKMIPPYERGLEYRVPTKVYRYIFQKNDLLKDHSEKKRIQHIFPFLKNVHIIDVTEEHNTVKDVILESKRMEEGDIPLIFCYNYGKWQPVFFGKKQQGKIVFEKMGTDILYRTGIIDSLSKVKHMSPPFIWRKPGNKEYIFPKNRNEYIDLIVEKINDGEKATVKKGNNYFLSYMNMQGKWRLINRDFCKKEGYIRFKNVPKDAIYKVSSPSDRNHLSRPFVYINNEQVWY